MRGFFNADGPVFQFLSRMADLMLLNILFLLCSLPVVTVGASLAAMHRVTQNMLFEQETGGVLGAFFHAFRQNFRQSTVVWLMAVALGTVFFLDMLLIRSYFTGQDAKLLSILLTVPTVLLVTVLSYLMPLIARYENTLRRQFKNALILAAAKLPKTLVLLALHLLPVILFYVRPDFFFRTLIFWIFIGFALICYLCNFLLKSVFVELETNGANE